MTGGPALLIDATALDSEHRFRGIGTYTRSLVATLGQIDSPPFRTLRLQGKPDPQSIRIWRPAKPTVRLQWLWNRLWLADELRRSKAKVYHATDPARNVSVPGLHRIATLYDLIPLTLADRYLNRMPPDDRAGYFWMLSMLESAQHIIAISEFSKTELVRLRGVDPAKITTIPLGYDAGTFSTAENKPQTETWQKLHGPFMVYSGALDPHKNIPIVLQAMALLPKELNLVITGRAPASQCLALQETANKLGLRGRVRHLGFLPATVLPHLYRASLAFVFPSLLEGFGLPLLDAMACGVPVVAARASSLPEVGGDAPLYFDPHDPTELADQLKHLFNNSALRPELARLGKQQVSKFSWENTARATSAVYREVLAQV